MLPERPTQLSRPKLSQVMLDSPVLQHRGDGQGREGLGARWSSSFLKLPWGHCVEGEGWRPSPAGPRSCGAALGAPEGTAPGHSTATPAPGQEPQGEQLSRSWPCQGIWGGWDGHPSALPRPLSLPAPALCVCPAVQWGWAGLEPLIQPCRDCH